MSVIGPLTNPAIWRKPSVLMLLLANLIPFFGVAFFGWEVFPIMFLFWLENVVVGIFNLGKMLLASGPGSAFGAKLFLIPFFTVHYGVFTLVHGVFVGVMFGGDWRGGAGGGVDFRALGELLSQTQLWIAIVGLIASHGFSFATNYLLNGAYRSASVAVVMMQPYGRVVVLHIAILGGGFLLVLLGAPAMGLVLLIALKIGLDVLGHVKQHRIAEPAPDL